VNVLTFERSNVSRGEIEMPIYEYWCTECRQSFEKLRAIGSKDSEVSCPRCGAPVKRMVSVVAALSLSREGAGEMRASGGGGCACGGNCGCGHAH